MLLPFLLTACGGDEPAAETTAAAVATSSAVPGSLVAQSWQVRMANATARAPYEGKPGWTALFGARTSEALEAFTSEKSDAARGRVHLYYAAAYRQAALVAAHASVIEWGSDVQPTDPAESTYLVGVGGALLADAGWRGRLGAAQASKVPGIAERDRAWKAWADGGASWPIGVVAGSPGAPAPDAAGRTPDAGVLPHYALPEQGPDARSVSASDPGTLVALSLWHEAHAVSAGVDAGLVAVALDPWRLPVEPVAKTPAAADVPDAFLFLSPWTVAGDALFLADVAREGAGAVARHAATSAYAAIAQACTKPGPGGGAAALQVDCVLDEAAALGRDIESGMKAAAATPEAPEGVVEAFHRPFADYARVGVLRAAERVARATGDAEASGRLRVNALDRTSAHTTDAPFLLGLAAWDTSNRNTARAEELLHGLLTEVPGLEAARLPLDALHVRVSRNSAPGRPMH